MTLQIPFLPKEEIRARSEAFLAEHHPSLDPPVPIDSIIEFRLGLDVVPASDLLRGRGINGFHSADLRTIYVDRYLFENVLNRYRFTLGHELGHLLLHGELYPRFRTEEEWLRFHRELSSHAQDKAEWQADEFAGLILVPAKSLGETASREAALVWAKIQEARANGEIDPTSDPFWDIASQKVGRVFEVASDTARIRMQRDGLWGRNLVSSA